MKKTMLLLFVCAVSTHVIAQKTKAEKAETTSQSALSENDIAPPPPPPPVPPVAQETPTLAVPPVPPVSPVPPVPPVPPAQAEQVKFMPPVIVNDKGYTLSVHFYNGKNLVYMKKNGVTEKISLDKWNANKSFYENKYGQLPPPPPPPAPPAPPAPPVEN